MIKTKLHKFWSNYSESLLTSAYVIGYVGIYFLGAYFFMAV
jgi:hypothetical protein